MTSRKLIWVLAAATLVAGCAENVFRDLVTAEPTEEFGHSVRHMVQWQSYDPAAGQKAGEMPGPQDGTKAAAALDAYRTAKSGSTTGSSAQTINLNMLPGTK